ncbi:MAG TPA: hypothetical protein VLF14_12835 [Candidatus Binatia bacterium]|nr:hypothetical protein [Candidatus Binatia bacterium]
MGRKHKALVLLLLFFVSTAAIAGCSASLDADANPRLETADDGGQEEVLDQDDADDNFGRPENSTVQGTAGGVLVTLGYLGMTLGSAALPFLMFL